jgi:hypothetical protein
MYKFLIIDTSHPDTVFTGACMEGSLVIFWKQKGSANFKVWTTLPQGMVTVEAYSREAEVLADTTEHALTEQSCINTYVRSAVLVRISRHRLTFRDILHLSFPPFPRIKEFCGNLSNILFTIMDCERESGVTW